MSMFLDADPAARSQSMWNCWISKNKFHFWIFIFFKRTYAAIASYGTSHNPAPWHIHVSFLSHGIQAYSVESTLSSKQQVKASCRAFVEMSSLSKRIKIWEKLKRGHIYRYMMPKGEYMYIQRRECHCFPHVMWYDY